MYSRQSVLNSILSQTFQLQLYSKGVDVLNMNIMTLGLKFNKTNIFLAKPKRWNSRAYSIFQGKRTLRYCLERIITVAIVG